MTAAGLTAAVDGTGRYSLTGTATVQITQGVSGNPSFHAGLSLSSDGIVAGVGLPDLSGLGFSGAGTLYAASSAMKGFDPATLGLSGQPVDLPAGLDVSLGYTLPDSVTTDLQDVIPAGSAVQAMASLPTTGFTVDLSLALGTGTGTGGLRVINSGGTSLYLDSVGLAVTLSAGGGVQVAVSGVGYLELPALVPGTTDPSAATVTVSGSLQVTADSISLGLSAGFSNWYHNEVLGIPGLGAQDFGGHVGLTYEDGATAPVPSLGIDADNITLPASWASAIGMAPGAEISFNVNLDLNNPVLAFSIAGPTVNGQQQPALTPLAVDPNLSSDVVNSFTISRAAFDLSPFGGTDPGTGDAIPAGASAIFDANVDHVPVHVDANVNLSALSVTADVSIGAFTVGPVQVSSPMFYLDLSVTQSTAAFGISGGISYNGNSFYADIQFAVGTSAAGASVTLAADGQLSVPIAGYLAGGLTLYRAVSGDGSGASISASGSAWLTAGGSTLGPVSFYFSIPGSLSWTDVANSITQVAQFFVTTGNSADTVIQYLQHIGYDTYDIINALSEIGDWGPRVVSGLANAFGFSSTYYDIWTFTSSAESLVLDVSGGSQSPSASVITWDWNNGYNQDWAFVQSPYPGWYEVVNRGSGQCLTVQYNTSTWGNPLIQYPCGGAYNQLWYMGSISLGTTYSIPNALDDEVIDVAGAYPWPGGSLDQWPYNGGWNQQFWLTNSHN